MSGFDDVSALVFEPSTLNMKWYYVTRIYETADQAKTAFKNMNEYAARLKGMAEIAGYRLLDDLPTEGGEPRIVCVIGQIGERVREAAQQLGGEPWVMHPVHVRGLILRRIRFLLAAGAFDLEGGVHVFHHGGGMRLDDQGQVVPNE